MNEQNIKLLVCGDLCITNDINDFFVSGNFSNYLDSELLSLFTSNYDLISANLECPLTNNSNRPIKKIGPNLRADFDCAFGLKQLNVDLVTLANNHIFDYGIEGVNETVDSLNKYGINFIGLCNEKDFSGNYRIFTRRGIKIGYYALCENEFSSFKNNRIGANSIEHLRVFDEIRNIKKKCDVLLVLYHGGKEYFRYPTPFEQKICRNFVECGADLVVAQHSHCIGAFEKYLGKTIVYGQGNFIFGKSKREEFETSLLVDVSVDTSNNSLDIKYIPIEISNNVVRISNNKKILEDFFERSNCNFENAYIKYIKENKYWYFYVLLNKGKLFRFFDIHLFHFGLIKRLIRRDKEKLLSLYNIINCESHRETILCGIEDEIYGK